jgi:intermediate peptidase
MEFLTSVAQHHRPAALADLQLLAQQKRMEQPTPPHQTQIINAWDKDYYSERYIHAMSPARSLHPLFPYFSAGTILQGLSRLFTSLYGLSFVSADMRPGEAWHPDVRKLNVVDEVEGVIGVIYCDLFSRPGKPPSAAHYTVRCSRRIDDDDPEGDLLPESWDWSKGMTGVEDFAGVTIAGRAGRYQLPLVVLTTDFQRPSVEDGPSCLAWQEVETLFHEMGHAIHCECEFRSGDDSELNVWLLPAMLGRTEYHNVSGTRCATDFVELPSILMEQFVTSPAVLPLFARHHATDAVLPLEHFRANLAMQSRLSALETQGQILMATLDQVYHSPAVRIGAQFDSTQAYHDLQSSIGIIPPVPGTAWQTQFGHLCGYGATYYSYLLDRAIAGKVWSTLFEAEPLSREGGETLRDQVLKWGGGRDPWEMVASVLQDDSLLKGDSAAMKKVGSWLLTH